MNHPIKQLSRRERVLWLGSLTAVALSNAASASFDLLALLEDPGHIPVAVDFTIFFFNDLYGFVSWRRRELRQTELAETA